MFDKNRFDICLIPFAVPLVCTSSFLLISLICSTALIFSKYFNEFLNVSNDIASSVKLKTKINIC